MKMTDKQKNFCELYVQNGWNGTEAYHVSYGQDDKNTCAVEASKMLKSKKIQDYIDEIEGAYKIVGHKCNINKERIMEKLAEMLESTKPVYFQGQYIGEHPDATAINNAIQTYAKLVGDFAPEKKDIRLNGDEEESELDISKLSEQERESIKEQILNEV